MDPMHSGMRYTPKATEHEWDPSLQFLPASDSKKLEKKKGLKAGAVIGLIVFFLVISLMTGLLVWHFHFRKVVKIKKMYTGSMRITNQVFVDSYENPNSTEFKTLAKQVSLELREIYSKTPQLSKYYIDSTIQAFSEGSVIAYYTSEFHVPSGHEDSVDRAMSSMDQIVHKSQERRRTAKLTSGKPVDLVFDDVVTAELDTRLFQTPKALRFYQHTRSNHIGILESPGFPNYPYPPNQMVQWQLRADRGYVIKLDFDTFNLEENCKNDFVRIYDSLVAIESRVMDEICGYYSPSDHLAYVSSGNVMLVTFVTNEARDYPGFRAHVSQIPATTGVMKCGGTLSASSGTFKSPNYPDYYPPFTSCVWSIQVPSGKYIKVTFEKFLVSEPGQDGTSCSKDYVKINGKKLCGEFSNVVETAEESYLTVVFSSDASYVDRGFTAKYEAFEPKDPCPKKFMCGNSNCIDQKLKCDGWNDCGDNSDESDCKCSSSQISCRNGMCKPKFWLCDGVNDCGDNTDEQNCGFCSKEQFTCPHNNKCISEKQKCDGRDDCGDGSDEAECARSNEVKCTQYTYQCKNKKCVSKLNPECDGTNDCTDGSDEENCDCGKQPYKTSRIVGGQDASQGEFPWQVSLHIRGSSHVCGASIISDRWLVTAAHCVQDDAKTRYSQPGTWDVYLGLHEQRDKSKAVKRGLKRIISHPSYNAYTFDCDIALMELDSPVTFTDAIRPICLPSPSYVFPVAKSVWITGWGATREGGYGPNVLQKAEVRIINGTVCNDLMGGQLTSRMLCAGVLAGGVDACQGDSGGPLSSLSTEGRRMFLAGVVSWGDGCARRNKPGIYTTVTKFRGWIKEMTQV
ncbi:ST14 transmembrane serine protease matriptase a [Engraulis encrasicolus]|uniref:ST14 transmembrane serine protease matriptase a n=1 Tax=Engraulis encrasicolus TaxID=184585 RepID=UPI002FD09261